MRYNYQILIEYDGLNFVGWQFQKNGKSVQETIEKNLSKILKKKIKITGAGRTDKGVHALGQSANFLVDKKIENKKKFLNSINYFLQKYLISIIDIKIKNLSFNSRYDAKERTYEYKIINRESYLAINKNRAWLVKRELDLDILRKGAKILEGKHDYSTFRASSCSAKSPIRKISKIRVNKRINTISIKFKSKSFLQNQVRSMVGCLKYLAEKKWTLRKFKKVLILKKRSLCAPPAPAHGLYLVKIRY
ncbi:MAG: tRNA pseudouridine(38-40) synthase TruA [Candidatus Pelagibacter sp.]